MAGSNVKLLGARLCPFVNRVQVALNLKSINYEFLPESLPDKSQLLLKTNPVYKNIPVLIDGDKPICESLIILQYIDEAFPDGPSILPSDPYEQSTARFWATYVDVEWFPLLYSLVSAETEEESKAAVLDKIQEGLTLLEDVLVKFSHGRGFFGGDTLGYLDIVLGCFMGWLKASEITSDVKILDETMTPALAEWLERFISHKAFQGTVPEPEELLNLRIRKGTESSQSAQSSVPIGIELEDLDSLIRCQRRQQGKRLCNHSSSVKL